MRLLLNGKLPTKEELAGDELVSQMLIDAENKGKTSVDRTVIIQTIKVEEVPEPVKQTIITAAVKKETILQTLTVEDAANIPAVVKQKILADGNASNPGASTIVKEIFQAFKDGTTGSINDDNRGKVSLSRQLYEAQ
jgi:hypothetical protein